MTIYSTNGVGEFLGHLSERRYDREFNSVTVLGKHSMKSVTGVEFWRAVKSVQH